MLKKENLAIYGGKPAIEFSLPHFSWGMPSANQVEALNTYIANGNPMSIYGDDGIYRELEEIIESKYTIDYCILTNTGTSSLNSAYIGVGISRGDEVIVPTYTFLATVTPLIRIGAIPVFVDCDPFTGNVSPNDIRKKITSLTKAIVVTHMWGQPCLMDEIVQIAREAGVKMIEDCSHAHLTPFKRKLCGTFGDVACFSIGAQKTWTCGEGGFLITNGDEIYIRATLLGHFENRANAALEKVSHKGEHGLVDSYKNFKMGYGENYRMHPYAAVMAKAFLLNDYDRVVKLRRESLIYLHEQLNEVQGVLRPALTSDYFEGAMYGYKPQLMLDEIGYKGSTQNFVNCLRAENMQVKLPDTFTLHNNPVFSGQNRYSKESNRSIAIGNFEGASAYLKHRISLPTFSGGKKNDKPLIDQYISAFEKVISHSSFID